MQKGNNTKTKKIDVYAEKETLLFFCISFGIFFVLMVAMFQDLSHIAPIFACSIVIATFLFLWLHKTREGIHPIVDVLLFSLASLIALVFSDATLFTTMFISIVTAGYTLAVIRLHSMFFRMRQKKTGSEVWDFLIDLNLGKARLETGQGSYLPEEFNHITSGLTKTLNEHLWHDYRKERELCAQYALANQFTVTFNEFPGDDYLNSEDGEKLKGDFKSTQVPFMAALTALKILSYFLNDRSVPIKIKFIRKVSKELAEAKDGNYILVVSVAENALLLKDVSQLSKKNFNTQIEEMLTRYRQKGNVKQIQFLLNENATYQFIIQFALPD